MFCDLRVLLDGIDQIRGQERERFFVFFSCQNSVEESCLDKSVISLVIFIVQANIDTEPLIRWLRPHAAAVAEF